MKPSVEILTSESMMEEFMQLLEIAGRTCWKSEERRETQIKKLVENPEFDPDTYEGWKNYHPTRDLENIRETAYLPRLKQASKNINKEFLTHKIRIGHESIIEHGVITVRIITDRATTHQLVRHRIAAYSQESQRFVDYLKKGHIAFIMPLEVQKYLEPGYYSWSDDHGSISRIMMEKALSDTPAHLISSTYVKTNYWTFKGMPRAWVRAVQYAEHMYNELRESGCKPELARSILPNTTKTEIITTYNIRQWRHVLKLRTSLHAQKDIRDIMGMILDGLHKSPMGPLFEDIQYEK